MGSQRRSPAFMAKRSSKRPLRPISPIPGAIAVRVCRGGAQLPIPQYAAAVGFGSLWIACRSNQTLERRDLGTGALRARIRVGIHPWVITTGAGAVWALERDGDLVRINPARNKITAQILLPEPAVYAWAGAGGVWLAMDDQGAVRRLNPRTNKVGAPIPVGLNPSGFADSAGSTWLTCHGDQTLWRIRAGRASKIGQLAGGAPERITSGGHWLWVTGRGTQLLRLDPQSGRVLGTTSIGAGGIDLAASSSTLWTAIPTAGDDRSGLPKVARLLKLNPNDGRTLANLLVERKLFLTGMVSDGMRVWLIDTYDGLALRLPK